jgi:hypothetical protein
MTAKTAILMSACALIAAGIVYFGVIPFQRELIIVGVDDVTFYDGIDSTKIIFQLSKGDSANIVECRDTKSMFEPAIRLNDGRIAYRLSGRFEINAKPSGLLSRPRYLGCPGY